MENELITQAVNILASKINPEKIYLFGSQVEGNINPDSDIDLMVVVQSDKPQRIRNIEARIALFGLKSAFDIFVYTPEEVKQYSNLLSSIPWTAINRGKLIYEHH